MRVQSHERREDFSLSRSLLKLTFVVEIAETDLFMQVLLIKSILVIIFEAVVVKFVVSEVGERTHL